MTGPLGDLPTRFDPPDGPTGRVAIITPGRLYVPTMPLLEFARQALLQHGWTVQALWWDELPDLSDPQGWVETRVRPAVEAEHGAEELLVVGKSLGTRAAAYAATQGLPAIWLTPLLVDPADAEGIVANPAPQLAVGGLADELWDPALAAQLRTTGVEVLEVADADHVMCVPGDAVRSVEIHLEVSRAIDGFLRGLGT